MKITFNHEVLEEHEEMRRDIGSIVFNFCELRVLRGEIISSLN